MKTITKIILLVSLIIILATARKNNAIVANPTHLTDADMYILANRINEAQCIANQQNRTIEISQYKMSKKE